jgi:hypothetical protein
MNLEGTWRAVVGYLEGNGPPPQSLGTQGNAAKITIAWRVGGKKKYKANHALNALTQKTSDNKALPPLPPHTPPSALRTIGAL